MTDEQPIMAFGAWKSNAELIVACRDLGYLADDWITWDATYGEGTFWRLWRPATMIGTDIDAAKSDKLVGPVDFTASPWDDRSFDCVVLDAPYKLNGRPDAVVDARYGVHERTTLAGRLGLITAGVVERARVLGDHYLPVKCQDQVNGGIVRWQTDLITDTARNAGLYKIDRLDMPSYRPQPLGRGQQHARRNTSTLLVFSRSAR